jgi:hypothetical protein
MKNKFIIANQRDGKEKNDEHGKQQLLRMRTERSEAHQNKHRYAATSEREQFAIAFGFADDAFGHPTMESPIPKPGDCGHNSADADGPQFPRKF